MKDVLLLAADGKARASIFVAKTCDRVTRFAARELSRYLAAMTGAKFSVQEAGGRPARNNQPAILVGTGDCEKSLVEPLVPCVEPFDGYSIRAQDNRLFIGGHNSRSTLYGVYDFLETIGCRFVEPGIEHVPQVKTLAVRRLHRKEVGAFPLRNIFRSAVVTTRHAAFDFLAPDLFVPQIDWMAKRRLNHHVFYIDYYRFDLWEKHKAPVLNALLDRGFNLEVTHHSLHYFCPPDENHDFSGFGPATYQRDHPDWYIPSLECGSRGRWQTRVELPAVRKIVIQRFLDYARRNPELKIIGLWPDDIPMNNPSVGLNPSDGYLRFWNQVADALAGAFPDKLIGIIAYFELIRPPRRTIPRPNEHCWYCPMERNFHYPLRDKRNHDFLKHLKSWTRKLASHRLAVFDYYGWSAPFVPYRDIMKDDLQLYRELGVGGQYAWTGFTRNILGEDWRWALDLYVLAHLLWNPLADARRLEQTWAEGVFGASAARILDFFDFLKRAHHEQARKGLTGYILQDWAGDCRWISLEVLRRAQQILDAARKTTADPRILRRIALLEKMTAHGATAH